MDDLSNVVIITNRLKLVPLSEEYAPEIFRELTEEISKYMFPVSPKKIEETLEYIHSIIPKTVKGEELAVVILNKETGEYVGGGGAHRLKTNTPELGIWIKKSAHGNKYGREAVKALKEWIDENIPYTHIVYPVDKRNIASRKIAESLGGVVRREYKTKKQDETVLDEVEYWIEKN